MSLCNPQILKSKGVMLQIIFVMVQKMARHGANGNITGF